MAGQALQGIGGGQQVEIAARQPGPGGEIGDAGKWPVLPVDSAPKEVTLGDNTLGHTP